jgi:hypothetical protein
MFTQRASQAVGCMAGVNNVMQTVVVAGGQLMIYVNGALVYGAEGQNVILAGQAGVGVIAARSPGSRRRRTRRTSGWSIFTIHTIV